MRATIIAIAFLVLASVWTPASFAQASAQGFTSSAGASGAWRRDATLRDIFFLDADRGWAVGDQGTILRTDDGGRSWQMQPIDLPYSLRSICFVDELNGWIAGGYTVPLVDRTHAVLLRTRDGGKSWQPMEGTLLPAIRRLKMDDVQNGWAWGSATQHFPSGIFVTSDGGRSWSDSTQWRPHRWTSVERTTNGFAVTTEEGVLGTFDGGVFRATQQSLNQNGHPQLMFFDPQRGWAVSGSFILTTDDGGKIWRAMTQPAADLGMERFDFRAAASAGAQTWIAGSPGSYIFCWNEASQQWSRARTPIRAGIERLCFIDEMRGWAVGQLGTILLTRDGGETWQVQRSAGDRIGLLAICRSPETIPFDTLARVCAEQGYLAGVLVGSADSPLGDGDERAREACLLQGVCCVVTADAQSPAEWERDIVSNVRQFQPSVIVIADEQGDVLRLPPPSRSQPASATESFDLEGLAVSAINAAADVNDDRDWINHAALAPWQTPQVYTARPVTVESPWGTPEYLPTLGKKLFDQVLLSKTLISSAVDPYQSLELVGLADRSSASTSNLMGGIGGGPAAPPRRPEQPLRSNIGQVKAINGKHALLDELAAQFDSSPASVPVWRQRIDRLIADVGIEIAGSWLWQLSEVYARTNQMELAAFARAALVEQCGEHPLACESRLWLAAYYSSDEFAWREFRRQLRYAEEPNDRPDTAVRKVGLRAVPKETIVDGVRHLVWTPELPEKNEAESDPRAAPSSSAASPHHPGDFPAYLGRRLELAQKLFRSVQQRDPELSADPIVAFAEALLKRKVAGPIEAESELRRIRNNGLPDEKRLAIIRELRLLGESWGDMRDVAGCPHTDSRPYLDGVLDDPVWRSAIQSNQVIPLSPARPASTSSSNNPLPNETPADPPGKTLIMFAHDAEFLYVAARCEYWNETPLGNSPGTQKRTRDGELSPHDCLHFALDIDRDCRSFEVFSIDERGAFVDKLGDNRQWNPTWYLAHHRGEGAWMIEAAIPLEEIAPQGALETNRVWGIAVRRQGSADRLESWSPVQTSVEKPSLVVRFTKPDFLVADGVLYLR